MRFIKKILVAAVLLFLVVLAVLFAGEAPKSEDISYGVTFSRKYAQDLGLDWQETYLSLLDDLGVRKMRIVAYWDLVEAESGSYDFDGLDWKIEEAEKRNIEIVPVVGIKVPRWPECHIPLWAEDIGKEKQQEKILKMIEAVVSRYKNSPAIVRWQVENEPFLDFGECPWYDKSFLLKEIELVRTLDPDTPIIITESGELSSWFSGAKLGDIVGVTMYRRTWWHRAGGFYFKYPVTPVHYYRKAELVRKIFNKEVVCVELQAEPWGPSPTYVLSLEEQERSMNLEMFKENIEFAEKTGISEFYLWGSEWWYWMKKEHNRPEFWEEARKLF